MLKKVEKTENKFKESDELLQNIACFTKISFIMKSLKVYVEKS